MQNTDRETARKEVVGKIDGKPYYYIDSSIIIILQRLDEYIAAGSTEEELIAFMTKNNRMNEAGAKDLLKKYHLNQKGELIFCITPTVYRETMLDARIKVTRDFVRNNCRLAMPNMNLAQFANLVKTIAIEFEEAKSKNGHKGLAPEIKKETGVDDNLEDRTILAEAVAFSIIGKRNIRFLTCGRSKSKVRENDSEVISLGKKYRQCQVNYGRSFPELRRGEDVVSVFMHSNHNDFGDSTRDSKDVREVSFKVKQIIEKILNGKSKLNILTPDEVEKGGF